MPTSGDFSRFDYTISPDLAARLDSVRENWEALRALKEESPARWETVRTHLTHLWTHHSVAIEGTNMTQQDTLVFLQQGVTVEGRTFRDYLDMHNHVEAIQFVYTLTEAGRSLALENLLSLHRILMLGVPISAGEFKTETNMVIRADGSAHAFMAPEEVPSLMEALAAWINTREGTIHPILLAALSHYHLVSIHPFQDGNGRCARLLMNLLLLRAGFPPVVIHDTSRRDYYEALRQGQDGGSLEPFIDFIGESLDATIELATAYMTHRNG